MKKKNKELKNLKEQMVLIVEMAYHIGACEAIKEVIKTRTMKELKQREGK